MKMLRYELKLDLLQVSVQQIPTIFEITDDESAQIILSHIAKSPKTIIQLMDGCDMSRFTITRRIRILEGLGIIKKTYKIENKSKIAFYVKK